MILDEFNHGGISAFPGNAVHRYDSLPEASQGALRRRVGSPHCALILGEAMGFGKVILSNTGADVYLVVLH